MAESRLVGVARALGWILAALAGLGVVALVVLFVRMASYSSSIFFEEPQVHAPLGKARITRVKGVTNEVFATLASGVKVEDVVNLDLFAGFDPAMTREVAERRLGPPQDSRLGEQLLQWLPPKDVVQMNVLRSVGWGGLTVFLSRDACTYLVLTARDGEPASR